MVGKVRLSSQLFPFFQDLVPSSSGYFGSKELQSLSPQLQETDENSRPQLSTKLLSMSLRIGSVKGKSSEDLGFASIHY